MKKILSIVISIIILSIPNVKALEPTYEFYVNDYANILSEETEKYIVDNSAKLDDATGAQIVVVTVPNLGGESLETYSTDLFRHFGIGDKDKNNGLLILVALEERKCRVEVGYGLEGVLPDAKTGRFQDEYMIPYFKNNNFDEGILNGYKAFYKEIAQEFKYETEISPVSQSYEDDDELTLGAYLLIGKVIYTFIVFGMSLETKKKKIINFIVLEIITIIITCISFAYAGTDALYLLLAGTFFNIIAVLVDGGSSSGGGYYGGYSSHSGGGFSGGHSGGGGSSGGGSSGGGGSSRSF